MQGIENELKIQASRQASRLGERRNEVNKGGGEIDSLFIFLFFGANLT